MTAPELDLDALERKLEAAEARVRELERKLSPANRDHYYSPTCTCPACLFDSRNNCGLRLAEAEARVRALEAERDGHRNAGVEFAATAIQFQDENAALRAVAARLAEWTHQYGAALKPVRADTFGDGMREAKSQVASILAALPKVPT